MTLPAAGAISFSNVGAEIGYAAGTTISLVKTAVRNLTEVGSEGSNCPISSASATKRVVVSGASIKFPSVNQTECQFFLYAPVTKIPGPSNYIE